MVYKKYVYKKGKRFGPYYCESYRDEDGKVRTRFVSGPHKTDNVLKKVKKSLEGMSHKKLSLFLGVCFLIFLLLLIGNINYSLRITGRVIGEQGFGNVSEKDLEIAEKSSEELVSDVDMRETTDLQIKTPILANKILELDYPDGKVELEFDLLNYGFWAENEVEQEVSAEEFGYCSNYCFDGVKNYDEDEVDCSYDGGSCPSCSLERPIVREAYSLMLIILVGLTLLALLLIILYLIFGKGRKRKRGVSYKKKVKIKRIRRLRKKHKRI